PPAARRGWRPGPAPARPSPRAEAPRPPGTPRRRRSPPTRRARARRAPGQRIPRRGRRSSGPGTKGPWGLQAGNFLPSESKPVYGRLRSTVHEVMSEAVPEESSALRILARGLRGEAEGVRSLLGLPEKASDRDVSRVTARLASAE